MNNEYDDDDGYYDCNICGDGVRPVWKCVKELQPHCPNCKERLSGNNSIALPYKCSCGTWLYDDENPGLFNIEPPF